MDNLDPKLKKDLKKENLYYSYDKTPGFFRQKFGKKFKYYDLDGKLIRDRLTLSRIESLSIPPAWKDVWVCPKRNGHLQATGVDDRNRKQYIYHSDWIKISQSNKFSKMVDFGLSLPNIRSKIQYDLQLKKIEKRKIVATIIWLLEHTFIRVGNEEYSKANNSFGLTTLRNKHVRVWGNSVSFDFRGKSGVNQAIEFTNPLIAKTIKKCSEIPGFELFKFFDEDGNKHVITSEDVNLFLQDVTKDDFSAKDFRTWGATYLSATNFFKLGKFDGKNKLKQNIVETVKKVASHLNNTVSVCKNYYIHPTVIQTYEKSILVPHFDYYSKARVKKPRLSWDEYALIKLLQKNSFSIN